MEAKHVSDSLTTQVQLLNLSHLNGYARLFGGQLVSWMDIVAGVTARRHAGTNVTTARIDGLQFARPAHANDTLVLEGRMAYAGRTSMIIKVTAWVEKLNGERELTNQAWFVMVALDDDEKPTCVPPLIIETEEEKRDMAYAEELRRSFSKK